MIFQWVHNFFKQFLRWREFLHILASRKTRLTLELRTQVAHGKFLLLKWKPRASDGFVECYWFVPRVGLAAFSSHLKFRTH